MKYIVAVKYRVSEDEEDLSFETELFEFDSKENRSEFIKEIKHIAQDIALSQISEEYEDETR